MCDINHVNVAKYHHDYCLFVCVSREACSKSPLVAISAGYVH